MASRVTVTSNIKGATAAYAAQAKRGPAQLGWLLGSAVEAASEAIVRSAIVPTPTAIPAADAYVRLKGRRVVGKYSKSRVVSRSGYTRASFLRMTRAAILAESYRYASQNMALDVRRVGSTSFAVWRSVDGGKTASLENKSWTGRQVIPGRPPYQWPIVSGKPRRFINKRWSMVLRVLRKALVEHAGNQGRLSSKLPQRMVVPRG